MTQAPPSVGQVVGSRVVEIDYTSPTESDPVGNFVAIGLLGFNLNCGMRVIEIGYESPA